MQERLLPEKWYTVEEAAKWLGVSVSTIRRLCYKGTLVSRHLGRRLYVAGYSMRADAEPVEPVKRVEQVKASAPYKLLGHELPQNRVKK